jgi:hypothetical protein
MSSPSELLEWNSEDESIFRQFIETRTGAKLCPRLAELAPTLLDGAHANKTLVRNGELRGYQFALQNILFLAYPPPPPVKETAAYPPLEDDDAWDGEKLNEPKK